MPAPPRATPPHQVDEEDHQHALDQDAHRQHRVGPPRARRPLQKGLVVAVSPVTQRGGGGSLVFGDQLGVAVAAQALELEEIRAFQKVSFSLDSIDTLRLKIPSKMVRLFSHKIISPRHKEKTANTVTKAANWSKSFHPLTS